MQESFRDKQQKSYTLMRMTYDLAMAVLILGMAVVMLFSERLKIDQISTIDATFRYLFGGICILYGGFRLYRGIKRDY
ncbi:MAG: hypothetical protein NTY72_06320 [Bacteroidetes bacterium]|jgi:hypothetical protein|nr:hypothetical protein [Bacteroidota bacterium]